MSIIRHNRKPPSLLVQLADVVLIELTNWRWSWPFLLVTGVVAPVISIIALGAFAQNASRETLTSILTGNVVLSLIFGNLDTVQTHFTYMRVVGTWDYFAALNVRRYILVIAALFSFLLISLPAVIVTILFGSLYLGIPLSLSPLICLVVPFSALSLAGIGALIGLMAHTPQEAKQISLCLILLLFGIGPVLIPANRLPKALLIIGYFSPTTYAASAFRQVLLGPLTPRICLDLAVLASLSLVTLWLVGYKMDWRKH
jgi:ABC-2 type transport system permease protein